VELVALRNVVLAPGEATSDPVEFERVPFHTAPLGALGYRCGNHEVIVVLKYTVVPSTGADTARPPPRTASGQIAVRPRAGIAAVVFGGIAGVLLAGVLSHLQARVKELASLGKPAPARPPTWRARLRSDGVVFLYGIAVTTTAIYLLQATTVPGFPVAVSLCDPLGGMILGLFFRPIGRFVHDKMSPAEASA
jgi:hypothetical protein